MATDNESMYRSLQAESYIDLRQIHAAHRCKYNQHYDHLWRNRNTMKTSTTICSSNFKAYIYVAHMVKNI